MGTEVIRPGTQVAFVMRRDRFGALDQAADMLHMLGFPSPTGRVLSNSTLSKLLRELGIGAVPHGFRSSFRDWAAERTDVPHEVCELALAHVNSDRMEAAYRRSDLFAKRRCLMDDWTACITAGNSRIGCDYRRSDLFAKRRCLMDDWTACITAGNSRIGSPSATESDG